MAVMTLTRMFLCIFAFLATLGAHSADLQPNSLLHYAANTHSQRGEDGILQEVFKRMGISKGFFVEFGAWDGILYSNTRKLAVEQGWSGAFIEAEHDRYLDLVNNYKNNPNILCIDQFVTWEGKDPRGKTLDLIADQYFPNQEIDFLSVDIDGADFLILEGLKLRPKVLCIEGGFGWNPYFTQRVPDHLVLDNLGQPLAVMIDIARKKGYEPIAFTQNLILVRKDLYPVFSHIRNDAPTLWKDAWCIFPEKDYLLQFRASHGTVRHFEGPLLTLVEGL